VFLVNSRYRHFSATLFSSACKKLHLVRAHLIPKLRCQFAEFLNQGSLKRLGILSPPTCVGLRYDHLILSLEAFLGSLGSTSLFRKADPHHFSALDKGVDFPAPSAYKLEPPIPTDGWPTLLRPPIAPAPEGTSTIRWYRNINLFSITYAFRPRLRDRLTLSRLALLRKPWAYGVPVFHRHYRYSCQHGHFCSVHPSLQSSFNPDRTLPYRSARGGSRSFGSVLSPVTFSAQTHSTSELLRFL
jgi:hypothetical protein